MPEPDEQVQPETQEPEITHQEIRDWGVKYADKLVAEAYWLLDSARIVLFDAQCNENTRGFAELKRLYQAYKAGEPLPAPTGRVTGIHNV